MLRAALFQLPALLLAMLVLYVCIIPIDVSAVSFQFSDKVAHVLAFAPIAFAVLWGFGKAFGYTNLTTNHLVFALLFAWLWGGMIELLQHYLIATRQGDWFDFLADGVGAAVGVLLYHLLARTQLKRLY